MIVDKVYLKEVIFNHFFDFLAFKLDIVNNYKFSDYVRLLEFFSNVNNYKNDIIIANSIRVTNNFNNISQGPKNANFYLIYKISTLEDSNIDDSLLMSIYYNIDEEKIILD